MDRDGRLKWIVIGVLSFLVMSMGFWGLSMRKEMSSDRARNASLDSQLTQAKAERDQAKASLAGDGIPAITGFAQAFFVFNKLSDRYAQAKPFLTDNGYKSLFPSGPADSIADSPVPISATISQVEPYFRRIDERHGSGMLVLKHELKVNNAVSATITYVKLALIRANESAPYLIDRVEIVHQQKL